jgi:hypothetical protein
MDHGSVRIPTKFGRKSSMAITEFLEVRCCTSLLAPVEVNDFGEAGRE